MNRIIVVTGGAGGIGRCIVAHFASQGDSVYFIDQNQQATLTQVEKMRERGLAGDRLCRRCGRETGLGGICSFGAS